MTGEPESLPDREFPAEPYPGTATPFSFAHVAARAYPLTPDPTALAGWRLAGQDLDQWLATRDAPPLAGRIPVLAYGSNRCPSKITWLRRELGLSGPVVALRAETGGVAAVWATGLRQRDGQRPATLVAAADATETHQVWLATPAQLAVLDRCEGRDVRHRLVRLNAARVRTADGGLIDRPWCYLGLPPDRSPLLLDGQAVRCTALDQAAAQALPASPATGPSAPDGLDATPATADPHPDEWPATLFAYGLLQPGQSDWHRVEPHRAGPTFPARAAGTVYDTGHGYPALRLDGGPGAPGAVVPLRDPAALLPQLDAFEGPSYQRVRIVLPADGTACWAYACLRSTAAMRPLPGGWPP